MVLVVCVGTACGWGAYHAYVSEDTAILIGTPTASWIEADEPSSLKAQAVAPRATAFLRRFDLTTVPSEARVRVRSLRSHVLSVNGSFLEPLAQQETAWVRGSTYEITSALGEGENLVAIAVENDRGPPSLLVDGAIPELRSGPEWLVLQEEGGEEPVRLADEPMSNPLRADFPSSAEGLRRVAPQLAGAFLLCACATTAARRWRRASLMPIVTPSRLRWLLLGAWVALCLNNIAKLPLNNGFDTRGHFDYILAIIRKGRLPLANEGWQAFQSPLYHTIAAGLHEIATSFVSTKTALYTPRLLSMMCGVALIEIAFRSARRVFDGRRNLQTVATLVGGMLPMSVYICQEVGNEPLAGALGAGLLAACMAVPKDRGMASRISWGGWLGALFGLAVLAKVSALLLAPALAWVLWRDARGHGPRAALTEAGAMGVAASLVAGWIFVRNYLELGRVFVGGWDRGRGIDWWQDPGSRTVADFFRFGDALDHPVYSGVSGLWDGLYSTLWLDGYASSMTIRSAAPPWSWDYMVVLALLAAPLTLALIAGCFRIPWIEDRSRRTTLAMFAAVGACFVAAIAYVFLIVPIFSTVKATYALSLAPAIGILVAQGIEPLLGLRGGTTIVVGYLGAWVVCVVSAFWIR